MSGNTEFDMLQETQKLLMEIYTIIGRVKILTDIPDNKLREDIFAKWIEIGKYLEKEGISLVY